MIDESTASSPPPLGDIPPDEARAALHAIAEWVANYRDTIEQRPIAPRTEPGTVTDATTVQMPEHGEPLDAIMADLDRVVMPGIVHWGHPAFLGYFGSTSNAPALVGEIAAAALNVSAMTWKTSPAATELETVVLEWIRAMIGLDDRFMGIVYDTASIATLHALAAAREVAIANVRREGLTRAGTTYRIYTSDQAHSSIAKAAAMLGLGEDNVVRVRTDSDFRIDTSALAAAMRDDASEGHHALAVVATVGSTSTASVDPLAELAALCREHGAWLHVDAAYGGALAALPEGRWVLEGASDADSIVINPHKWLFVPLDFSALYTRRPEVLRAAFSLVPEYLRGDSAGDDDARAPATVDYMDYGIQLGRRFRALKAWMVFRAFGRQGIEARIREHVRLARLLASWIDAEENVTLAAPVTMAVVCFRFAPPGVSNADCDRLNERIVERVNATGQAYVTHTRVRGRTCVRVGFGNILTTEQHLAHAWEIVLRESRTLGTV